MSHKATPTPEQRALSFLNSLDPPYPPILVPGIGLISAHEIFIENARKNIHRKEWFEKVVRYAKEMKTQNHSPDQ